MKILSLGLFAALTAAFSSCSSALAVSAVDIWKINPAGSAVKFEVKNFGLAVNGNFKKVTGQVQYDGKHLEKADVKAAVEVGSIDTGIGARDHHLESKDFFDASKFPQATFVSQAIETQPDGSFLINGRLTLHGFAEDLKLKAKPLTESVDQSGQKHLKTEASTDLKRKDFKIGGFAAATISNPVNISLVVDLVK